MFVTVAYMMAVASLVGPSQAATTGGRPSASERLMASPATTGSSTSRPRAMIREAIETCCRSMPSMCIMPKVMARVRGMERAMSRAERHSQKPMRETRTTRITASSRLVMKRWMFSSTCRGWSEVRARTRSSGSRCWRSCRAASTAAPKRSICSPARIWTERVTARVRCQLPSGVLRVKKLR